jgi:hypothetical protein
MLGYELADRDSIHGRDGDISSTTNMTMGFTQHPLQ